MRSKQSPYFLDRSISALQNGSQNGQNVGTYISVAKPDGRFGQKLESLQAGQESTGQGKTGQDRAGQRDRSKAGRAKVEQSVGKSREGHDGHGHFAI